ncbi:immunoglobulin-like domain-containing protein [Bacillus sp. FJAT-27986]|uniref:immunoglobulin-like domain-containing protein n=1 Tax=Bacillus sp. FJAT-27986 TaxID=1743146 RepID=UPI001111BC16|nr:immunoglobulin-like domain-containing protein [Bacillus sp. FJAT-27986]
MSVVVSLALVLSCIAPGFVDAATDKTKPTITGAKNATAYLNHSFNPKKGVVAKDNVDGNITSRIKIYGKVNTKKTGKYTLTYKVTDKAKNTQTVKRVVTVKKDTTKPKITGVSNKTVYRGYSFNPKLGVKATDNADGNLTSKIKVTGKVNTKKVGKYKIKYTVTDKTKNKRTVTRTITVKKDTTKPTISGVSNKSIFAGTTFKPLSGVTAKDNADGNITKKIKVTGKVNTNKIGTYKLTYSVSDKTKNKRTVTRKIYVKKDTVKPTISGAKNKTINIGTSFNPRTGVTAKDNVDGSITKNIKISGTVNTKKAGSYKLAYTVTDKAKNKTIVYRTVKVVDNVKPVINGANNTQVALGDAFDSLKGVSASDNNDGNLTAKIKVEGTVNVNKPGTYKLTYTVSDKAGNKATKQRNVTVVDKVVPVINGVEDVELPFGQEFDSLKGVTATDNYDGDLTSKIKVEGTVNVEKAGSYPLTYSVTDQSGNEATVKRTVTVIDSTDPILSGVKDLEINFGDEFDPLKGITASDNNDGDITSKIKVEGAVNVNKAGSYKLTYSVSDESGNNATAERTVTVIDNVKPEFSGVSNVTIGLYTDFNVMNGVTASDNNDGDLTSNILTEGTVDTQKEGDYTVTYTVSDAAGNTEKVTRVVTVQKIPVSNITISAPSKLRTGKTQQLTATITPTDATEQQVTWTSSDESIATISEEGTLKTISEGTVTITATADGISSSKTIVVADTKPSMYFSSFGTGVVNGVIKNFSFTLLNQESTETVYVEKVEVYENNSLFTSYSASDIQNAGLSTEISPYSGWRFGLNFKVGIWEGQSKVVVTVKEENGKIYQYSRSF